MAKLQQAVLAGFCAAEVNVGLVCLPEEEDAFVSSLCIIDPLRKEALALCSRYDLHEMNSGVILEQLLWKLTVGEANIPSPITDPLYAERESHSPLPLTPPSF